MWRTVWSSKGIDGPIIDRGSVPRKRAGLPYAALEALENIYKNKGNILVSFIFFIFKLKDILSKYIRWKNNFGGVTYNGNQKRFLERSSSYNNEDRSNS